MNFKERDKLVRWAAEFCDQKYWEGCKGLRLTDDMKLRIAGNAGLLVLGWDEPFYFPRCKVVLVYPDHSLLPIAPISAVDCTSRAKRHLKGKRGIVAPS